MELGSKLRWLIVVFILLFVLVFVGWGLSTIARNVFNRSESSVTGTDEASVVSLENVKTARYIVDGPVVANAEHRRYQIEVSRNVVTMTLYSNYGQKVLKEKNYSNNEEAYATFMKSLESASATARYNNTDTDDDLAEQGVCPEGRRYILELDDEIRRWTTSCDRNQGTAAGKMTTMRSLFTKQVPDFQDIIADSGLNATR